MKFIFTFFVIFLLIPVAKAQDKSGFHINSVTVEGGPIWTKHFQSEDEDFRENHGLGIIKVSTENHGNWGIYYLAPNSVDDPSFGAGYVTNPWVLDLGLTDLELTGALGLVTGYQDYPVPLIAAQARLKLYERGNWNAGIAAAVLPYIVENTRTGDNNFGIVGTTPFLSVRYSFN